VWPAINVAYSPLTADSRIQSQEVLGNTASLNDMDVVFMLEVFINKFHQNVVHAIVLRS
jgi:hypothetical protein